MGNIFINFIIEADWGSLEIADIIIVLLIVLFVFSLFTIIIRTVFRVIQAFLGFFIPEEDEVITEENSEDITSSPKKQFKPFRKKPLIYWGADLPYKLNKSLLTDRESEFFKILEPIVNKYGFRVKSKVRMADVINLTLDESQKNYWKYFKEISQKHFDFCICDPISLAPVMIIELDDKSHESEKAKKSDRIKNIICNHIGLKLLRITLIDAIHIEKHFVSKFKIPCTNCGGIYMIRTNSKTDELFGGCSNFQETKCNAPTISMDEVKLRIAQLA